MDDREKKVIERINEKIKENKKNSIGFAKQEIKEILQSDKEIQEDLVKKTMENKNE